MRNLMLLTCTSMLVAVNLATAATPFTTTTEINFNSRGTSKNACKTDDNKDGICIEYKFCRANHTIDVYGNIDNNEIRAGQCPGYFYWCCYFEEDKQEEAVKSASGCTLASDEKCPWCMSLYRDGGNPNTKAPSGLFCAGALIGEGMVLTTASCAAAARNQKVWAQFTHYPYKNYTVSFFKNHPDYNSGTRDYDFAVAVLEEKLNSSKGACIQLNDPSSGQCRSYGFGDEDNAIPTVISTRKSRCDEESSDPALGWACATSYDQSQPCKIALGSPVMCPYRNQYGLWGIARSSCRHGSAQIGSLAPAAQWLKAIIAFPPTPDGVITPRINS